MSTVIETTTAAVASVAAPTDKQMLRLAQLGYLAQPATRSEASRIITNLIAQRDMQPATDKQRGRAAVLGGRDLPGAGVREVSTQIALLEALAIYDAADPEDQDAIQLALDTMVARIRERFCRPLTVTVRTA